MFVIEFYKALSGFLNFPFSRKKSGEEKSNGFFGKWKMSLVHCLCLYLTNSPPPPNFPLTSHLTLFSKSQRGIDSQWYHLTFKRALSLEPTSVNFFFQSTKYALSLFDMFLKYDTFILMYCIYLFRGVLNHPPFSWHFVNYLQL